MKKILGLAIGIVLIIGLVAGGTWAYFSDTEGPQQVTFAAGTVDIAVDSGMGPENPWTGTVVIEGAKPCQVKYVYYKITNVGNNPVVVYKHLVATIANPGGEPLTSTGILAYPLGSPTCSSEPEYEAIVANAGVDKNDLDTWIMYDLYSEVTKGVGGIDPTVAGGTGWHQWEYDENVMIGDLFCVRVPLGTIMPGGEMYVLQSYHLDPNLGDIYQGDDVVFFVEFYAQQLEGTQVVLENKSQAAGESYVDFTDTTVGYLDYNSEGPTFDYTFEAYGLQASTSYNLIYYADPWAAQDPNAIIATFTTDGSGNIPSTSGSIDLGMDLPSAPDDNVPQGAKIWLVPTSRMSGTKVTSWVESEFLFETHTIVYDDIDV